MPGEAADRGRRKIHWSKRKKMTHTRKPIDPKYWIPAIKSTKQKCTDY